MEGQAALQALGSALGPLVGPSGISGEGAGVQRNPLTICCLGKCKWGPVPGGPEWEAKAQESRKEAFQTEGLLPPVDGALRLAFGTVGSSQWAGRIPISQVGSSLHLLPGVVGGLEAQDSHTSSENPRACEFLSESVQE